MAGKNLIRQNIYLPGEMWHWINCQAEELNIPPAHIIESIVNDYREKAPAPERNMRELIKNITRMVKHKK